MLKSLENLLFSWRTKKTIKELIVINGKQIPTGS